MAELPDEETVRDIKSLMKLMAHFRDISPSMTVSMAVTFLSVAANEGTSLVDLKGPTGFKTSTLSRHLIDLGDRNRKKEAGLGLVDCRQDPMELRKNQYTLTPKGRTLLRKVLKLIEKD